MSKRKTPITEAQSKPTAELRREGRLGLPVPSASRDVSYIPKEWLRRKYADPLIDYYQETRARVTTVMPR